MAAEILDHEGTSVHEAAEQGNVEMLQVLLNADGACALNHFDYVERTPLRCAVQKGHLAAARFLIGQGANVNAHDEPRIGNTALHDAAAEGTYETVELLLKAGADPRIEGWMSLRPLDKAEKRTDGERARIMELLKSYVRQGSSSL